MTESELFARLDRLESTEAIRQLPARYCAALDTRDWDALVNLFIDDVGVPGDGRGRQALKRWYDTTVRAATVATAHLTSNHIVEFESADRACGLVYSRNEIELEQHWMFEMMIYLDCYERRYGEWYFNHRTPLFWYECDSRAMPIGTDLKLRWPDKAPQPETWHSAFPSWRDFIEHPETYAAVPVTPRAAPGSFLTTLRRGEARPRVNPSGAMFDPHSGPDGPTT